MLRNLATEKWMEIFCKKTKRISLFCVTVCSLALARTDLLLPRDLSLCDVSSRTNWNLLSTYHSSTIGSDNAGFSFPQRAYVNRQWAESEYLYLESAQYRSAFSILPFVGIGAKSEDSLSSYYSLLIRFNPQNYTIIVK